MRALRHLGVGLVLLGFASGSQAQDLRLPAFPEVPTRTTSTFDGPSLAPPPPPRSLSPTNSAASLLKIEQLLPSQLTPGQPVPIEILVRNISSLPVDKVTLVEEVPAGYRLQEAVPTPRQQGNQLVWALGSMRPGEKQTVRLTLDSTSAKPGMLNNRIFVDCQVRQESTSTSFLAGPELKIQVQGGTSAFVNAPQKLQLVVANHGRVAAEHVLMRTVLGEGLSHPQGTDLESEIASIAPGQSHTIPLEVTPQRAGVVQARFTVRVPGTPAVTKELSLSVTDMQINVKAKGPVVLQEGLTGLFHVTVTNAGRTPVTNARVAVVLPTNLPFAKAAMGGDFDPNNQAVYWTIRSLSPGESRTFAWNCTAKESGFAICKLWLVQGQSSFQKGTWVTEVTKESSPGTMTFESRTPTPIPHE